MLRYTAAAVVVGLVAGGVGWGAGGLLSPPPRIGPSGSAGSSAGGAGGSTAPGSADEGGGAGKVANPTPTAAPPTGGTELYGYLPYWQMNDTMAAYLDQVPVTTLALFSVTTTSSGGLKHNDTGYARITGARGNGLIADAHRRSQRVELVYTSFGYRANANLFGDDPKAQRRRARAARELANLASVLGVDGVNVDVELIDGDLGDGYGLFLLDLGSRLRAANPHATLSVATTAGSVGSSLARAAIAGGVDRVFLMGYDYHWSGSVAGASSPIDNRSGTLDLAWSIASYVQRGVPRDRIVLGLPLYGMSWPVSGPGRAAEVTGKGSTWIPSLHTDVLLAPGFQAAFDQQEIADYFVVPDGAGWIATYYDSPRSLRPKLELARSEGLAGAGFWALGYERGLPGYLELMAAFRAGRVGG
ncbi:MAG: hypothetical protein HY263_10635 [Chloroflexi bacterium]|nr:hypothetical protein [Chloroflexota bacterium]